MKLGMFKDISNDEYHRQRDASEHFYSSSQLKTMLDDPETFYKTYITGELVTKSIPAFDIGTYYHTAILEPHLLDSECAVFKGKMRKGKEWEKFKADNEGKAIITVNDYEKAKNLIVATRNSEVAMGLLEGGEAEVSLFIEVTIASQGIFIKSNKGTIYRLDKFKGWVKTKNKRLPKGIALRLKVRADKINKERGFILDLKSTTGNAKNVQKTRYKTSDYVYDLSCSMYLDLFNAWYLIIGEEPPFRTFWWVYASKDLSNCCSYWTGVGPQGEISDKTIMVGRAKWMKAAKDVAKFQELNWEIPDEPACLEPMYFEEEWLKEEEPEEDVKKGRRENVEKVSVNKAARAIEIL